MGLPFPSLPFPSLTSLRSGVIFHLVFLKLFPSLWDFSALSLWVWGLSFHHYVGEEFKEHEMEDDTRPKRSKIPRTIIEDLGTNKTRDKNSPEKEKGITPTEQNASDQAIQIMAMNVKLEPVLTTFEVDEEQGRTTVNRLDDYEEERLAVQGPSSINVKVNKASKVYEVKYSKNGQVQTTAGF